MNKFTFLTAMMMLLLPLGAAAAADDGDQHEALHALFSEYDAWYLREYPEEAMMRGDYSNAHRITDVSLAAIDRRHEDARRFRQQLDAIQKHGLSDEDQLNYDLFALMLDRQIRSHQYRMFLAPINSRSGPQQSIPQMGERVRFANVEDYENYLSRLALVPQMVNDTIAVMRKGMAEGITPPRITLIGVPQQFDALLNGSGEGLDALHEPFEKFPETISEEDQARLSEQFDTNTQPAVRQALQQFGAFIAAEYLPACREIIAASDLPNGEAMYANRLRDMTTTDMTAQEIHELGLSEVTRIRAEMMQIIRSSDFMEANPQAASLSDDALFSEFINYLRTDDRFYHDTPEDLLRDYRAICKEIDEWMPRLFGHLPRLSYGVKEIPAFIAPTQTTAYYSHGSLESGQPGYYYVNTYDLRQRPKYEMIALSLHEAVPGHHHQVAIAQELENVPEFRKTMWFTAYGEGWALYAERLGIEMGLYDDPYDDFGRLLYEMWRACRLVVDPGMHAMGWTRQQAIDFMLANTALSELNITNEVDRYISWPGQATAYKIGELKIRELRSKAQRELGAEFDLRTFHDVVLKSGSIPLDMLELRINRWIRSQTMPQLYD